MNATFAGRVKPQEREVRVPAAPWLTIKPPERVMTRDLTTKLAAPKARRS